MVAVLSVILLLQLFGSAAGDTRPSQTVLLGVIDAIERLVGFYKTSYNDVNLDGFFGLRAIEGQIQRALQDQKKGGHGRLSPAVVERLKAVLQDVRWVSEKGVAVVKADDESYFNKLGNIIAQPWSLFKPRRTVVPSLRWDVTAYISNENRKLGEQQSDKCMMEITKPSRGAKDPGGRAKGGKGAGSEGTSDGGAGTGRGRGASGGDQCSLSQQCGRLMTRRGLTDYGITHQLLWTALAERAGCDGEMNGLMQTLGFNSTEHMQREFCTNNFFEMVTSVHLFMSGTIALDFQDLFMEQQFVCPSLGFHQFLKKDYLDQILSWQLPSGCFGESLESESVGVKSQNSKSALQNLLLADLGGQGGGALRPPGNSLASISKLDLKKQDVEQQLKQLQFLGNLGLGSEPEDNGDPMMGSDVELRDLHQDPIGSHIELGDLPMARLQGHLQQLQQQQDSRDTVAAAWKQAIPQQQQHGPGIFGEKRLPGYPPFHAQQQQQDTQRKVSGNPSFLQKSAVDGVNMLAHQAQQSLLKRGPPRLLNTRDVGTGVVSALNGQYPFQFQKDMDNSLQQRLTAHSGLQEANYDNKLNGNPPLRSHGNFPNIPQKEIMPPKKVPAHAMFPSNSHPGIVAQNLLLRNANANMPLHPEATRQQRRATVPRFAGQDPLLIQVQAGGQHQPLLPGHGGSGLRGHSHQGQPRGRVMGTYDAGRHSQRRLLVEKEMPGGCLSHKTGVAGAALAMYLHYLISPAPRGQDDDFYSVDNHKRLLGIGSSSYEKVVQFLKQNMEKIGESEDGNEEREEEEEEAGNEDDGDDDGEEGPEEEEEEEVYPDAMEVARQQRKKVLDLWAKAGGDTDTNRLEDKAMYDDSKDRREEEDEEGIHEDEEEGPDYIKRFEGDDATADKLAAAADTGQGEGGEDTEYTYYEEGDNPNKAVARKQHKPTPQPQPQTPPHAPYPAPSVQHHNPQSPAPGAPQGGLALSHKDTPPPTKALVVLLSATSLVLILLVCKFLRKRRIYLKYGSRALLRL